MSGSLYVEGALDVAARRLKKARQAEEAAMEAARVAALAAIQHGMTEVDVAKQLGVNRMTVRRWQGKR
jgi:transposase